MSAPESQEVSHGPVYEPVVRHRPQEAHADLGLIDDDHSPDMRPGPRFDAP
jgi:hypothetical protein